MRAWSASLCIASLVGACGIPESDIPGSDMGVPFVCPTNWAGPSAQAINPALVHIEDGELILEASSEGVTVETPLGSDVIGSVPTSSGCSPTISPISPRPAWSAVSP